MQILSKQQIDTRFPRSAKYDLSWVAANQMGPNSLWLAEALCEMMDLKPGMRVLDLGCGKAITSVFLAKEFGVQVWAADLWISASENWQRIRAAGLDQQIFPLHCEAHTLPFADEFFDAAVSLDAYHYFGTNDLYYGWYFNRLLKPGGKLGILVPGVREEIETDAPPAYLQPYWNWDYYTFHCPNWWRRNFTRSGTVEVTHAAWLEDGWKYWLAWQEYLGEKENQNLHNSETEMLRVDQGKLLGFSRVVVRKK
jgi:cyclopropane fatty-acyl-phospholipid synthase-like methyltransferase